MNYPYLASNGKCVVLFTEENQGVIVRTDSKEYKFGTYGHFEETAFNPLKEGETIVLKG